MDKNCDQYIEEYLSLDKGQQVPLHVTLHLLGCPHCRAEVRMLSRAERLSSRRLSSPSPLEDESISTVLRRIDAPRAQPRHSVSVVPWLVTGIILTLALLLVHVALHGRSGGILSFSVDAAGAAVITAYIAICIGANLDFFIKRSGSH